MASLIQSSDHALLGTDAIFDRLFTSFPISSDLIETTNSINSVSLIQSSNHTNECTSIVDQQLQNPLVIFLVICMVIINLVIILGNFLVILSVFLYTKLRTVTNLFILSLAVADLLLGLSVVPYSLTQTISKSWYFGKIWCMGWLVIDVWLSTASILNLVAISVDRYLAITKPLRYRTMMTAKRAKILIACAWIVSFLICFPPLVHTGLNKEGSGLIEVNISQKIVQKEFQPQRLIQEYLSNLPSNQHSSSSYLPKETNPVELNRWSNFFATSNKFLPETDIGQRNKRDKNAGEIVTSAPLIADPNLIWSGDQAHVPEHTNTDNLEKKIKSKFKTRFKSDDEHSSFRNEKRLDLDVKDLQSDFRYKLIDNLSSSKSMIKKNGTMIHRFLRKRKRSTENKNDDELMKSEEIGSECDYTVLQCVLFDSKGYVIYSAVGSFFIPMIIMIFFYWRIYLVAMYTTNAMNRGYISKKSIKKNPIAALIGGSKNQADSSNNTAKYGSTNVNNLDANSESNNSNLTLRVHRGYVKEQQLTANLTNGLNRRSTNRSSYDSSGRNSTCTTVTVRANSTIDTTASQLCKRLLPSRLSSRLLWNNDAKQMRKIQHRSVRCLDRTQNIISLAADSSSRPRISTAIKRTQSEHCMESNQSSAKKSENTLKPENTKMDDDKLTDRSNLKSEECPNLTAMYTTTVALDNRIKTRPKDVTTLRISNSEKYIPKFEVNLRHSASSGNLPNRSDQKQIIVGFTKPNLLVNSLRIGSQVQVNMIPPEEHNSFDKIDVNDDQMEVGAINVYGPKEDGQVNGYHTNIEINDDEQKDSNLNEQTGTQHTCDDNLIQSQTIQITASGSKRSKNSYWSRLSRKRTYFNKTTNQTTNNSGRFEKKRFLAETKAAKTVGIIVGCFWLCWFPFFTVYLTRGLCEKPNCIPDIILTLFTWLGYINSALNPIIYGMFSKDFRRAFKNIICKCKFSEETGISTLIRQIHLPNLFEEDMI